MNREDAGIKVLDYVGVGIRAAKEAHHEITAGTTRERLELAGMVICVGAIAITSYGAYKTFIEGASDE